MNKLLILIAITAGCTSSSGPTDIVDCDHVSWETGFAPGSTAGWKCELACEVRPTPSANDPTCHIALDRPACQFFTDAWGRTGCCETETPVAIHPVKFYECQP